MTFQSLTLVNNASLSVCEFFLTPSQHLSIVGVTCADPIHSELFRHGIVFQFFPALSTLQTLSVTPSHSLHTLSYLQPLWVVNELQSGWIACLLLELFGYLDLWLLIADELILALNVIS